jgi:hypothetical protein
MHTAHHRRPLSAAIAVLGFAAFLGASFTGCSSGDDKGSFSCCVIRTYCDKCQSIVNTFNPSHRVCTSDQIALGGGDSEEACAAELQGNASDYSMCSGDTEKHDLTSSRLACSR